jgi:hypothetical protein
MIQESKIEKALKALDALPEGKTAFFKGDVKEITSIFQQSKRNNNSVQVDFENNEQGAIEKIIYLSDINITQPNVIKSKVEKMLTIFSKLPSINAVKYKDETVIYDGHHRLLTAYLLGIKTIKINLVKL